MSQYRKVGTIRMNSQITKQIVVLANSRKIGGKCVAGVEFNNDQFGRWIRLVSSSPTKEVNEYDTLYTDGTYPQLLDIVEVSLQGQRKNKDYQSENWQFNRNIKWKKIGKLYYDSLKYIAKTEESLWFNNFSSFGYLNNRIYEKERWKLSDSLRLIRVNNPTFVVFNKPENSTNRKVKLKFEYSGTNYTLAITDPEIEQKIDQVKIGEHKRLNSYYLSISLGEPFNEYIYKFVAGIIKIP